MTTKFRKPDLPMEDPHGDEMLEYQCAECKRPQYAARSFAEVIRHRGRDLKCMVCEHPGRYRYEKITDQFGDREIIVPLNEVVRGRIESRRRKFLPGDKETLRLKQVNLDLTGLRGRKVQLDDQIETLEALRAEVEARIGELEVEITTLRPMVEKYQNDPLREKKGKLAELQDRIQELERELTEDNNESKGGRR